MDVTCPKGHKIEIIDPVEFETIVAVDTSGNDLMGVIEVPDEIVVKCNFALSDKALCGESFTVTMS